jgi:hypothetical protein
MGKRITTTNVVPIDRVDDAQRWVPARSGGSERARAGMRGFTRSRGTMFFSAGIPKGLVGFCYRSARRLDLASLSIFITRGTVTRGKGRIVRGASIRTLEWGVGYLVTIPRGIRYADTMELRIGEEVHSFRIMEIVALGALMRLAWPRRSMEYLTSLAAQVLARGWKTDGSESVRPADAGRELKKR